MLVCEIERKRRDFGLVYPGKTKYEREERKAFLANAVVIQDRARRTALRRGRSLPFQTASPAPAGCAFPVLHASPAAPAPGPSAHQCPARPHGSENSPR